jgi:hypothetical protein
VSSSGDPRAPQSEFSKSKWFTRGWTLQELIAPSTVLFYGSDWKEIGTKSDLQDVITNVTRIHIAAFLGDDDLGTFSIAQRMSWAANRKTTRTEDLAYCLLGLFDISMPMLYGEGERAFIRLQEELIRGSDDPTIFAWRSDIVWDFKGGLLARSPYCFRDSGSIIRSYGPKSTSFTLSNKGVRIQLRLLQLDNQPGRFLGVLDCHDTVHSDHLLGIFLQGDETNEDGYRASCNVLGVMTNSEASALETKAIYIKQWPPVDFKRLYRHYNHYCIRAANTQDHYPPGFVQLDGTINQEAGPHKNTMGAVKVAVNGETQVVVLMITDDVLFASIVKNFQGESLEEIVHSWDAKKAIWINKPGRIVQEISQRRPVCIEMRKRIVFGKRTLTIDIST